MPADKLILEKPAEKDLRRLPSHVHQKIVYTLRNIKSNPLLGVRLHGKFNEYYKVRIGDYRVVYSFNSKKSMVVVVKIEHRQGVYR